MAKVSHKRVRQLMDEKRSKITDRQFFTSRILAGHFEDIAAAQTRRYRYNRRVHVSLYWDPKDPNLACTDNTVIRVFVAIRWSQRPGDGLSGIRLSAACSPMN